MLDQWALLAVIRGIQGYCKTTLVASWLGDQQDSVRWVWVSAGSDGGDVLEVVDRAAGALTQGQPIVLVIDDAHWLRDEPILLGLVRTLARHQHLHLVMCSRGRHPIEDLAAGVIDIVTITARALLFTVPQVRELARSMGVPLSQERAEQIYSAIGGWAAAVRLVLDEIAEAGSELPLTRAGDYLRNVVLPAVGDQRGLGQVMRFSLAERLTHRLIRDFAEDHDPETLVRLVESSGLAERHSCGATLLLERVPIWSDATTNRQCWLTEPVCSFGDTLPRAFAAFP